MAAMIRSGQRETLNKLRAIAIALGSCALGCFALSVAALAESAQIGSATAPIRVSSKEADDNLQVKTLQPAYPPEAAAKGIEGTVRLRIVINERGNVTDIRSLSGNPLLVPSAIALVKRFPYRPFTRGGKRVAVTTDVNVPFALHPASQKQIYDRWMSHLENARRLRKNEKVEPAIGELQEALADAKKLGDMNVADTYGDMAVLYFKEGRYNDAEPCLAQRLDILRHSRIRDELEIANTRADLAAAYLMRKNLVQAQELLQHAIPVQQKYLRHATLQFSKDIYAQRLALSLGSLALLHDLQGQFSTAEPLYKRSILLGKQRLPVDDEALIMRRYAEMLIKMGRPDDAAKLKQDAITLQLDLNNNQE